MKRYWKESHSFFFFFGMIQSKNVLNWDSEAGSELLTPEHFLLIHSSRMFGFSSAAQTGISLSHCMSAEGQSITWPCIFRWLDHRGLTREEDSRYHCPNGKPFRKCHLHGMCAENPEVWHAWGEFPLFLSAS